MKRNMGAADRYLRSVIAFGIFALWGFGVISGPLAWVLAILATVLVATSLVGYCPLYSPFRFSTRRSGV